MTAPRLDLIGKKFGRLSILERYKPSGRYYLKCLCDCGNIAHIEQSQVTSGHTKSCGCLKPHLTKQRSTTHGLSHHRLRNILNAMKQRCHNPKHPKYIDYGARGIYVCSEWRNNVLMFYNWAIRQPHYNEPGYSLDRINNDGPYSPENCRWATLSEQQQNKRPKVINYELKDALKRIKELEAKLQKLELERIYEHEMS